MKILILVSLVFSTLSWAGRPDQAFSFKENTCVCRNDLPVSKGDCASVCRGKKTSGADVLFAEFSVSNVLGNSSLKHVKNWCYKYVWGDSSFPKCVLEAIDEEGNITEIPEFKFPGNNSFSADVSVLEDDQRYWFRLVEKTSGAKSIPYDIYVFDPVGVPLKRSRLSEYACYSRAWGAKAHFYHAFSLKPDAVPSASDFICHDVTIFGPQDSAAHPRLENVPVYANLWNQSNYLFFDNNGDGVLDVNELFMKKVTEFGGNTKGSLRLFGLLSSPGSRDYQRDAGNTHHERLGFVMSYWVNRDFRSYCPGKIQYQSGSASAKAMEHILGADTEGIYVADRTESEIRDYLFVREADLKAVWFYLKNGVPTQPSEDTVAFQTVFFHHPFNKENPYVKGPNQRTYRLRSAQEIGNLTTLQAFLPESGEMIATPAHDRKFACVPKL